MPMISHSRDETVVCPNSKHRRCTKMAIWKMNHGTLVCSQHFPDKTNGLVWLQVTSPVYFSTSIQGAFKTLYIIPWNTGQLKSDSQFMDNYNPWDRQNASISIIPCANNQQDSWTLLISLNLLKSPSNKNEAHRWERRETSFWNVGFPIGKTKITDSANDATKERWAQPPDSSGPVSIALKLQHPYRGLGDIWAASNALPHFQTRPCPCSFKKR